MNIGAAPLRGDQDPPVPRPQVEDHFLPAPPYESEHLLDDVRGRRDVRDAKNGMHEDREHERPDKEHDHAERKIDEEDALILHRPNPNPNPNPVHYSSARARYRAAFTVSSAFSKISASAL